MFLQLRNIGQWPKNDRRGIKWSSWFYLEVKTNKVSY